MNLLLLRMHIHRKKLHLNASRLWNIISKHFHQMLKHFEIFLEDWSCTVMQLFATWEKQREMTGQTENKHWTTILHTCPTKQAGVDCSCRRSSDPNRDTNVSPWFFGRIPKHSDIYAVVTFLILALKQGSHI